MDEELLSLNEEYILSAPKNKFLTKIFEPKRTLLSYRTEIRQCSEHTWPNSVARCNLVATMCHTTAR
jgi:hypothetical protein